MLGGGGRPVLRSARPLWAGEVGGGARPGAKRGGGARGGCFLPADNDDVAPVGEMRLVEVMMDVRQLFAPPRDAQIGGMGEVTRREDQAIPGNRLSAQRSLHLVRVYQSRKRAYADGFRAHDAAI